MPQPPESSEIRPLAPLPVVLGPTGSGKSALAISIALAVGGEIVNCDSLQAYRGFDVGTAKVPESERRGVPHHLIDIVDPADLFTAGDYSERARAALREIRARKRIPIVVGGTGFYLRALLEGLFPGPSRDASIRERLERVEKSRPLRLHRLLARMDAATAKRIHPNDKNKIIRALEVRLLEGKPVSELLLKGRNRLTGFRAIKIGLNPPRKLLYERLDVRSAAIFERGLTEEVRELLRKGVERDAKPFESIGYKQALALVEKRMTMEQALESTQKETRRYAKRQMTWFRKELGVTWLEGFGDDAEIQKKALTILNQRCGE